ncbi:hypothetical protein TcasGA2_TC002512 [Tribolium castaneum]|uniref:Uncharacterized protein n=1 Tax=Tribolium castaneum TaxID=7070 RepID=D6WH73_TRICA|nr:hypothetical protein TcasGA2_TC002512 [Tribolium castaneum]
MQSADRQRQVNNACGGGFADGDEEEEEEEEDGRTVFRVTDVIVTRKFRLKNSATGALKKHRCVLNWKNSALANIKNLRIHPRFSYVNVRIRISPERNTGYRLAHAPDKKEAEIHYMLGFIGRLYFFRFRAFSMDALGVTVLRLCHVTIPKARKHRGISNKPRLARFNFASSFILTTLRRRLKTRAGTQCAKSDALISAICDDSNREK